MNTQCLNFFPQVHSNGQVLNSLTWINILAIVLKDVFLKLILSILNYNNYTMIVLLTPDKTEIKDKCCLINN